MLNNCPVFEDVTSDVYSYWGEQVTLEFIASSKYTKDSTGITTIRSSEAFIDNVAFEEIPANPSASAESGLWGNSVKDGTGLSITKSSNGTTLLVWLTYNVNGKSVWYMSQPATEEDGVLSALLEKMAISGFRNALIAFTA